MFSKSTADQRSAFTATASKLNKSARLLRPKSSTVKTPQRLSLPSFVVAQSAFEPPNGCTDLCDILVHRLDSLIQRFSIVFALTQFSIKPHPHFANSPTQDRTKCCDHSQNDFC
jgi:hypothetical protein